MAKKKSKKATGKRKDAAVATISLASRIKKQRGTADATPLPEEWTKSTKPYLEPKDGELFEECRSAAYQKFEYEEPSSLPADFHANFEACFIQLEGLYLYDAIQPGGQRVSKTMVQRTLIGNPGSTYRYLGLRLFSHPWCSVDANGDRSTESVVPLTYSKQHNDALKEMGRLNDLLKERTKMQLSKLPSSLVKGSHDFTLTLVNRMQPSREKKDLKRDFILKKKTSVGWHKDSGLQDFSSIAVYHSLHENKDEYGYGESKGTPWTIALKVASKEQKTPALMIPMPSGTLYYLLDDFNHNHEHAVMSGASGLRYSSTHRVARGITWQTIRDKMRSISLRTASLKKLRVQQMVLTELEFEWLRQWYVQGSQHAELHPYWHLPMEEMLTCAEGLHQATKELMGKLKDGGLAPELETNTVLDVLIEAFTERLNLRQRWEERLSDPLYESLAEDCQPFSDERSSAIFVSVADTQACLRRLRKWKQKASGSGSSQTKNEKRKQGSSNWQAFQKQARVHAGSASTKKRQKR